MKVKHLLSMGVSESVKYYLFSLCYVVLLATAYIHIISAHFGYAGFVYDFSFSKVLEASVFIAILLLVTPKRFDRPSDFYINLFLFVVLVPISLLYCLSGQDRLTFYSIAAGSFLIYIVLAFAPLLLLARPVRVGLRPIVLTIFLVLVAITITQVALAGKVSFNYSLLDVYGYREESGELIGVGALSYLNVWATKVLLPSLVAFSVWFRRYRQTLLLCLLAVLLFGIAQHKSIIFYPYIVIAILLAFRSRQNLWTLPLMLSVVVSLITVIYIVSGDVLIPSLFVRRALFVPAYLAFKYHEFFALNKLVWWSSSFMSPLIEYPYKESTARVVGHYLGGEFNANNNFLSTGYMHAGLAGLFVYCILVGFILKLVDSLASGRIPAVLAVSLTLVPFYALFTSADLPTAIATHGVGLSMFLLFCLRSSSAIVKLSRGSSV